jgi:hypothetical protein
MKESSFLARFFVQSHHTRFLCIPQGGKRGKEGKKSFKFDKKVVDLRLLLCYHRYYL